MNPTAPQYRMALHELLAYVEKRLVK